MNEISARKAAAWWSAQLTKPAQLDNGDKSQTGAMTFALAMQLQEFEFQSDNGKAKLFEEALYSRILAHQPYSPTSPMTIDVDYHPDQLLIECCNIAGVNVGMTTFPWKTMMWVYEDKVMVAEGYQASLIEM